MLMVSLVEPASSTWKEAEDGKLDLICSHYCFDSVVGEVKSPIAEVAATRHENMISLTSTE